MYFYWALFIVIAIASYSAQANLKSKFQKYSKIPTSGGLTGCDVAMQMLHDHGIFDVRVTQIEGQLTDHYDPTKKTVNLSKDVYFGRNITAAAVAAHESGHAVQHAVAYGPLKMRSAMVPPVQFASKWVSWILLAGIFMVQSFPGILWLGIILFAVTTLFSFVTLPVEVDASRRAIAWLGKSGITDSRSAVPARDALRSAAYTYVVAALSSLGTLIYYVLIAMGNRN